MRILIIGGDGMLGHQLLQSWQHKHEVAVTLRQPLENYQRYHLFNAANSYANVDVRNSEDVLQAIADFKPEAVVNAAGIVKQRKSAKEAIPAIEINALFPHRLALMCKTAGARMIHLSTDCVFSGVKGNYTEEDASDCEDLYGKSKFLGEVHEPHCVTIRTSIIGLQLIRKTSLIEWFLAQTGTIQGYTRAIYSGLTTIEMARIIERVLVQHPEMHGLWQVASQPIDKYTLLTTLAKLLDRDIKIQPENTFACEMSISAARFNAATGYHPPSWEQMLKELAQQIQSREQEVCYV